MNADFGMGPCEVVTIEVVNQSGDVMISVVDPTDPESVIECELSEVVITFDDDDTELEDPEWLLAVLKSVLHRNTIPTRPWPLVFAFPVTGVLDGFGDIWVAHGKLFHRVHTSSGTYQKNATAKMSFINDIPLPHRKLRAVSRGAGGFCLVDYDGVGVVVDSATGRVYLNSAPDDDDDDD